MKVLDNLKLGKCDQVSRLSRPIVLQGNSCFWENVNLALSQNLLSEGWNYP
jgi:hypothetical protein